MKRSSNKRNLVIIILIFILGISIFPFFKKERLLNTNGQEMHFRENAKGSYSSAAVFNDETSDHLYTWGSNLYGMLGLGFSSDNVIKKTPTELTVGDYKLPKGATIKQVDFGEKSAGVIVHYDSEDHLYTWGSNNYGQLGLSGKFPDDSYNSPQEVTTGRYELSEGQTIKQISFGKEHSLAIVNDGTKDHLYAWGHNVFGSLGLTSSHRVEIYSIPMEVTTGDFELTDNETIKDISSGIWDSAAVVNDGTKDHLYTWGYNVYGELGLDSEKGSYDSPQEVTKNKFSLTPEETIKNISFHSMFSAAVVNDGTNDYLYTWGSNYLGQLGLGDEDYDAWYISPQEVTTGVFLLKDNEKIKRVELGLSSTFVITDDGKEEHIYSWGSNLDGELGLGDGLPEEAYSTPHEITKGSLSLTKGKIVKSISSGGCSTNAIISDNGNETIYSWGSNSRGECGLGDDYTDESYNTPMKTVSLFHDLPKTSMPAWQIVLIVISVISVISIAAIIGIFFWRKSKQNNQEVPKNYFF